MNDEQFLWYLLGFFEIAKPTSLSEQQTKVIREAITERLKSRKGLAFAHRGVNGQVING